MGRDSGGLSVSKNATEEQVEGLTAGHTFPQALERGAVSKTQMAISEAVIMPTDF